MCGIAGGNSSEKLLQSLEHRGQSCKVSSGEFGMGHQLHSVIGRVEQPLKGDGELVANCEIYNWKDLAERYSLDVENDAELLLELLDMKGMEALEEVEGVYAFAYLKEKKLFLARDRLGVKPVWYSEEPFSFASERNAFESINRRCRELHPRHILKYDIEEEEVSFEQRDFFQIDERDVGLEEAAEEIKELFLEAVEKRVPEGKELALLFSGGVDSTMVAAALKELGKEFTCYTSGIQHGNVNSPRDLDWAEKVAAEMELDLEVHNSDLEEVEEILPQLAEWISSSSTVKLGVALSFHLALNGEEKVVMSGLGSEQLYAGYHRQQGYLNKECLSGLRNIWHRDLYRDDVVSMRNGYELRVPFLDSGLVEHALEIPEELKVRDEHRKYVLRMAAEKLGVPEEVAWRKKTAAQYGSNFDKAIDRLAKDNGFESKQHYLNSFREKPDHRLAALTSGGKDSNAAVYRMQKRNNEVSCLVTLKSRNPDSYMFDTETQGVREQSVKLGVPLIEVDTQGEKEDELEDLRRALEEAKNKHDVEGVVAGALASTYQRDRVEKVAEQVGLKVFAPLWRQNQESYMRWLVREGFKIEIVDVSARGLDEEWVGRTLNSDSVEELIELSEEYGFNAAGEGGEYETTVLEFPSS